MWSWNAFISARLRCYSRAQLTRKLNFWFDVILLIMFVVVFSAHGKRQFLYVFLKSYDYRDWIFFSECVRFQSFGKGGDMMTQKTRAFSERRAGRERRKTFSLNRFLFRGEDRRALEERRSLEERRDGWIRVSKWSSVFLWDLKIAKFLR